MGIIYDTKLFLGTIIDLTQIDWKQLIDKENDPIQSDIEEHVTTQILHLNQWLTHFPEFKWLFVDYSYPYSDPDEDDIKVHLSFKLKYERYSNEPNNIKDEDILSENYQNAPKLSLTDLQEILSGRVDIKKFHKLLQIFNQKLTDPHLYCVHHIL